MNPAEALIERYVAVWNEPDASNRRDAIAALWRPDGSTCHKLLESRGLPAIEDRVHNAHEKWVRESGYEFQPTPHVFAHHDVVMFNWAMGPRAGAGASVVSLGLNFLLLDAQGRIRDDLQFTEPPPEPLPEHAALVERYVAAWNEAEPGARRQRVTEVWQPDGAHLNPDAVRSGHAAIVQEADDIYAACGARGRLFRCGGRIDGHHGAVRMDWELLAADGRTVEASGTNLLLVGDDGRLLRDIQFNTLALALGQLAKQA